MLDLIVYGVYVKNCIFVKSMITSAKKAELRRWAKSLRQNLDLKKTSTNIKTKVLELGVYRSAKTIMSYIAKDIEISLDGLLKDRSKSWFLSVVSEHSILGVPYVPGKTKLIKGKFNILEPEIINDECFDQISKKIKLDLIFVPGLCFDKAGNRLGFGVGFYDRFLKLNPNSFKIGCCPKSCLIDKLPVDRWDEKMDLVITD